MTMAHAVQLVSVRERTGSFFVFQLHTHYSLMKC